ncbi:rod shape-determining protein [Candidatus Woesebacteria bacterium]|nr:rod shape-determining protein [Candidatus Woesebacteria bacterium]
MFKRTIGVDMGTARTRLWSSDVPESILDEASCIAVDTRSETVVAVGDEAAQMQGRVGAHLTTVWPVRQGEVVDPAAAKALLRHLVSSRSSRVTSVFPASVMIATPSMATAVGREFFSFAAGAVGTREVVSIAQPLAAGIGAGVPIADASGAFVLQLGAGVVEAAAVSLGSVVAHRSGVFGGNWLLERLQRDVEKAYGIRVSLDDVRILLHTCTTFIPKKEHIFPLFGQDRHTGEPKQVEVSSSIFTTTLASWLDLCAKQLQELLMAVPTQLVSDSMNKGVLLSGGLAHIPGVSEALATAAGVPMSVVDEPGTAVIHGVQTAVTHLDEFKKSVMYQSDE